VGGENSRPEIKIALVHKNIQFISIL